MVFEGWSKLRIGLTVAFSLLFLSGVTLILVGPEVAQRNPIQYAYVALDAVVVAVLVFRPDLLPSAISE